jgi:hypothetical protein
VWIPLRMIGKCQIAQIKPTRKTPGRGLSFTNSLWRKPRQPYSSPNTVARPLNGIPTTEIRKKAINAKGYELLATGTPPTLSNMPGNPPKPQSQFRAAWLSKNTTTPMIKQTPKSLLPICRPTRRKPSAPHFQVCKLPYG